MTKETKELFDLLKDEKTYNSVSFVPEIIIDEVSKLEAKLKEMEVYLTKGGIILDRNGKQCHVGDKVKWTLSDSKVEGTLIFDEEANRLFVYEPERGLVYNPAKERIKLIEKASESIIFITPNEFKTCNGTAFVSDIDGNIYEVLYKSQAYDFFLRMDYFSRMADKKPVRMTFKNGSNLIYKAECVKEDENGK